MAKTDQPEPKEPSLQADILALPAPVIKTVPPENLQKPTKVTLTVYLQLAKIPPDQAAGFTVYAHSAGFGPQSMAEWKRQHDAFNKRPI